MRTAKIWDKDPHNNKYAKWPFSLQCKCQNVTECDPKSLDIEDQLFYLRVRNIFLFCSTEMFFGRDNQQ
jgi:hypothetical protein